MSAALARAGQDPERARREVDEALRAAFRPEFLNRIDDVILFRALSREDISKIVEIQLARVKAILADRHIEVDLTPAARRHLAEVGYDPEFGARPLKRALQREVQDPLAMKLLSGEIRAGDRVEVDAEGGALVFRRAEAAAKV